MSQIAISLPDDLQSFVTEVVRSGRYASEDELVVNLLYQVKEQESQAPLNLEDLGPQEQASLAALRADMQVGIDQLQKGQGVRDFNWDAFLDEMHAEREGEKSA